MYIVPVNASSMPINGTFLYVWTLAVSGFNLSLGIKTIPCVNMFFIFNVCLLLVFPLDSSLLDYLISTLVLTIRFNEIKICRLLLNVFFFISLIIFCIFRSKFRNHKSLVSANQSTHNNTNVDTQQQVQRKVESLKAT